MIAERMKHSLGRDRTLCRGEFGAAVSEQRRRVRSRPSRHSLVQSRHSLGN